MSDNKLQNENVPVLRTERLILRPLVITDAPAIQKYFNSWNIIKNLSKAVPWPYPEDGAATFIENDVIPRVKEGRSLVWGIEPKGGPAEIIGVIDYDFEARDSGGNRGFWLAEDFQGQGYMTEAVTAMQDYLFFELCIESLIVANIKKNDASRRVKQKTGANYIGEGTLPHHSGASVIERWEITRDSWARVRGYTP